MSSVFRYQKVIVISVGVFILSLMQIETLADQRWERKTQIPTERIGFATAVVGNEIYLIGGTPFESVLGNKGGPLGPFGTQTVEVYDTQSDRWQRVADMPTPRQTHKAAVVNDTIYVFGGVNREINDPQWKYPVNVEAYDPATDTWTQKRNMPDSRVSFDVGVVEGKIYVIGGRILISGERLSRVDVYNPATDTWVEGPKMPTPRSDLRVAAVGNRLYAIGGRGWPPVNLGPDLTVIEEYDATSHQWRQKSDMLDTRLYFGTAAVRDSIYLIGGLFWRGGGAANEYLASVSVYNAQKDAWSDTPSLPAPFAVQGAAAVNGRIYVLGGTKAGGRGWEYFPDVVVYDTGFRAVEAKGKLSTRWGELKAEPQRQYQRP